MTTLHPRAYKATVIWTLGLLFLGSIVHATESSLACPDWPTCFGTMVPEMTGGVFWEHLHRLVAGGLVLMFVLATWLARREASDRPWVYRASVAGVVLLLVQSVFGGLTVIYRLPDLISTTHLSLAFIFLSLATVLAVTTHGAKDSKAPPAMKGLGRENGAKLTRYAAVAAIAVFLQSVIGALVRHTDGGMSCPDIPLCLGQIIPPLINIQITSHFLHRVMAIVASGAVIWLYSWTTTKCDVPNQVKRLSMIAVGLLITQLLLGVVSVLTFLAIPPVSMHTLFAAALLSILVALATIGAQSNAEVETPDMSTTTL